MLDGKPLSAGPSKGAFMASPETENSFAAIELLREMHRRPLDLIFHGLGEPIVIVVVPSVEIQGAVDRESGMGLRL